MTTQHYHYRATLAGILACLHYTSMASVRWTRWPSAKASRPKGPRYVQRRL